MKHDIFEFNMERMTGKDIGWRVFFLSICIAVLLCDLLYWRPG